jgi:DNA polymerase III gamma/tau subunit
LNYLIDISEGDLRRSINLLQSISQLDAALLDRAIVEDICGTIPRDEIQLILDKAKFSNNDVILKEAKIFLLKGYDIRQFLIQLNDYISTNTEYTDFDKKAILELILNTEISLLQNSSADLQFINFLLEIRKIFSMD